MPRIWSCTWSRTTTPPISIATCGAGWQAIHGSPALHPTNGSWLNLVEVFFAIIERQALRRGDFASVEELVTGIRRFCEGWNERCQPFVWTTDAERILAKVQHPTALA